MPQVRLEVIDIDSILKGACFVDWDNLVVSGDCFSEVCRRNRCFFVIPSPWLRCSGHIKWAWLSSNSNTPAHPQSHTYHTAPRLRLKSESQRRGVSPAAISINFETANILLLAKSASTQTHFFVKVGPASLMEVTIVLDKHGYVTAA
jgi:hypothetical protein